MSGKRIVIVGGDKDLLALARGQLKLDGHELIEARDCRQTLDLLQRSPHDLLIADCRAPLWDMKFLAGIREEYPETALVAVTASQATKASIEAIRLGAYECHADPLNSEVFRLVVNRALEHLGLREQIQALRGSLDRGYSLEGVVGQCGAIVHVRQTAAEAAQTESPVMIRGEVGTGKRFLARTIHFNGRRSDNPFLSLHCGAIPAEGLESELFGHIKGSFAGATSHKKGKAEMANQGSLFLEAIEDLPAALQHKLLRLLREGVIQKVGSRNTTQVGTRIITASNRNLKALVEDGKFSEDLYYRLSVIPLELPPLRERSEDIPLLARHFFSQSKRNHGRPELVLPESLMHRFSSYRWPGNVRELEEVIDRVVALCTGGRVMERDLPAFLQKERPPLDVLNMELPAKGISLEAVEKALILGALKKFDWNQSHAARYLGLSRKTLIYRMEKYRFHKPEVPANTGPELNSAPITAQEAAPQESV